MTALASALCARQNVGCSSAAMQADVACALDMRVCIYDSLLPSIVSTPMMTSGVNHACSQDARNGRWLASSVGIRFQLDFLRQLRNASSLNECRRGKARPYDAHPDEGRSGPARAPRPPEPSVNRPASQCSLKRSHDRCIFLDCVR